MADLDSFRKGKNGPVDMEHLKTYAKQEGMYTPSSKGAAKPAKQSTPKENARAAAKKAFDAVYAHKAAGPWNNAEEAIKSPTFAKMHAAIRASNRANGAVAKAATPQNPVSNKRGSSDGYMVNKPKK